MPLPPGQRLRPDFPRFGQTFFARRFPKETAAIRLTIAGEVAEKVTLAPEEIARLPRVEQVSDFHCVTTWSCASLAWSGYRFVDLFEQLIAPRARPDARAGWVLLRGQDGYGSILPLEDLLAPGVLLADRLNGAPLDIAHGAPCRLVAPDHYGYKNVKHLDRLDFWITRELFRPAAFLFMDHPRARVAQEERGRGVPGWLLRSIYKPFIGPTVRHFRKALEMRRDLPEP
jgi:DMSO/TMAO reductase YedYZ molybdopterin-dependent catalytic subunit